MGAPSSYVGVPGEKGSALDTGQPPKQTDANSFPLESLMVRPLRIVYEGAFYCVCGHEDLDEVERENEKGSKANR